MRHPAPHLPRLAPVALAASLAAAATGASCYAVDDATTTARRVPSTEVEPCRIEGIPEPVRCGTLRVYEDRAARSGRILDLQFVVLPARKQPAAPDPVISIYGGPGQTATEYAAQEWESAFRDERELILLDQRGTSESLRLDCEPSGRELGVQAYLKPAFRAEVVEPCRARLEGLADLRRYTSAEAVDDLDDLRALLGYEKVNLIGGSYGSRAALVYLQRHPERVRSLVLFAISPFSAKLPLNHPLAAQEALDGLFAACREQPACRAAFPRIEEELAAVLRRLEEKPVEVTATNPQTGESVPLRLGRREFAEALRVLTYNPERASRVPLAIHRAHEGDYGPFATAGLAANLGLWAQIRLGMNLSVTCTEDLARITEEEIAPETRGTYLGDARVREQLAACERWPRTPVPADWGRLPPTQVPALLISGVLDPATPPRYGEEVAREHLPNSRHLVVGVAGHSPWDPCIDRIAAEFFREADPRGLDTSCAEAMKLAPFVTEAEP